jgi:hypothetical protein
MRLTHKPIEPIRKTRVVALDLERAFHLFTAEMGRWWPLATHSIAGDQATGVRFEGSIGGRVVELTDDGTEHSWAEVTAWDPPHRFALTWHPTLEPVAASALEVVFAPADNGTLVTLVHRGWEEFGDQAGSEFRRAYEPGWDAVLIGYDATSALRSARS